MIFLDSPPLSSTVSLLTTIPKSFQTSRRQQKRRNQTCTIHLTSFTAPSCSPGNSTRTVPFPLSPAKQHRDSPFFSTPGVQGLPSARLSRPRPRLGAAPSAPLAPSRGCSLSVRSRPSAAHPPLRAVCGSGSPSTAWGPAMRGARPRAGPRRPPDPPRPLPPWPGRNAPGGAGGGRGGGSGARGGPGAALERGSGRGTRRCWAGLTHWRRLCLRRLQCAEQMLLLLLFFSCL